MNSTNTTMNDPIVQQMAEIFNALGTGWVLWLLILLSIVSVAIMIERFIYFRRNSFGNVELLIEKLSRGDLNGAIQLVGERRGLEAEVLRCSATAAERGADTVQEIVKATILREGLGYEKFLAVLGTLGNNAPFIGLFGTVLGIIKAFAALAVSAQTSGVTTGSVNIMAGISEALVATAAGLLVAIPAVAVYNAYGRWLKNIVTRSEAVGYAITGHLKAQI